jgi:hypothetical protein
MIYWEAIRYILSIMPIKLVCEWVKGHYSGNNRAIQHDLNDQADKLVSQHLATQSHPYHTQQLPIVCPNYKVRILYNGSVFTSKLYTTLVEAMHDTALKDYILKKTKWSADTFDQVDWDAHKRAFQHLTQYQKIATAKLINSLANTNRKNFLYYGADNSCPGFKPAEETFHHVLTCPHPDTTSFHTEQLLALQKTLQQIDTPPIMVQTILHGFDSWLSPSEQTRSRTPTYGSLLPGDIHLTSAYYDQFHKIGWFQLCLGRINSKWAVVIRAYKSTQQVPNDSKPWTKSLITALWRFKLKLLIYFKRSNSVFERDLAKRVSSCEKTLSP